MIKSTRSRHKQINKIKELSNQQDQGTFSIPNVCDHAILAKKRTTKQIPLVQAQLSNTTSVNKFIPILRTITSRALPVLW